MRTLGVDLAAQPKKTAACIIEWNAESATVLDVQVDFENGQILALAKNCDATGIDSPFGWPLPFIEVLKQVHAPPIQPILIDPGDPVVRQHLRFRRTDLHVREKHGLVPLSVSCDKLGIVAMRCIRLLDLLEVTDRSGDGRVWEVYPAVALKNWGIIFAGPKLLKLEALLQQVLQRCPWLHIPEKAKLLCSRNHHAFDALIASLVTRAAFLGRTERPPDEDADAARREGWIAVPDKDGLGTLHKSRAT